MMSSLRVGMDVGYSRGGEMSGHVIRKLME